MNAAIMVYEDFCTTEHCFRAFAMVLRNYYHRESAVGSYFTVIGLECAFKLHKAIFFITHNCLLCKQALTTGSVAFPQASLHCRARAMIDEQSRSES